MARYILKRLLILVPTILVLTILIFTIVNAIPGDPASIALGTESAASIEDVREKMGLNESKKTRYFNWISNMLKGDFGDSYFLGRSVKDAIVERLPVTFSLATLSLCFAIIIGIPLGILASLKPNSARDTAFMGFSLLGLSTPEFFLGLLLMTVFSLKLKWFPTGGYTPMSEGILPWFKSMAIPAFSYGLSQAAYIARLMRSSMLEVLNQDYIETARSKGQVEYLIVLKHALRNAFLPILTAIGMVYALLLGGAFITESLFRLPGAGSLIISSIAKRDYPIVQGALLFFSCVILIVNLVVDILYAFVDPRVSYGKKI